MVKGAIMYLNPPHVLAGPVRVTKANGAAYTVIAHGRTHLLSRDRLQIARIWLAKGQEWHGPYPHWRAACDALAGLCEPESLPHVMAGLSHGRALETGAEYLDGFTRYRFAWGGEHPPGRFVSPAATLSEWSA